MSAIFGILRFDGEPVCPRELERMGRVLAHRGPDGRACVADGAIGLGHCRLHVNEEDLLEAQPIREPGVTLVADLRLDNREALAAAMGIAAETLATMPDSAVLLAAYRHWGADLAEHLLGDFTFAIWDHRARTLLLGRDHMGQRGLFYHHGAGFVAFATDVQALWAVEGVPRRLSDDAIGRRLLLAVDRKPGETFFEAIVALPNATLLGIDAAGAASTRVYWEPHAAAAHLDRDQAYYVQAYRDVLAEAVACRVRRLTRPPALCFSGGFDSGSIAALAGPIVAARGQRIVAIASVLEKGERRAAIRDARAAAEAFADRPFLDLRYYVRGEDNVFADLETTFAITHNSVGTPYVRRGLYAIAAAAGARLVMDGHGGDYTVNVRAGAMLGRMLRRGRFRAFVREYRMRMRATRRSFRQVLQQDVVPALLPLRAIAGLLALRRGFAPIWRTRPVADGFFHALVGRRAIDPSRLRGSYPVHNRWQARWLDFLRRTAAAAPAQSTLAAAHGLAFSRPFHDRRIVEFALAIPESLQFGNGLERHLARNALADILPASLLVRGVGNDAEDPDMFRMIGANASLALADARALDRGGKLSRYLDFDRLEAMLADADESRRADHYRLYVAGLSITLARFVAWFDRGNE